MGEPARGYSWPPFTHGNDAAAKSGADSERRLAPIVEELRAWAAEALPWASGRSMAPTVEAWAWVEARCRLYREWFDEHGHEDAEGQPLAGLERWDRAEVRAENLRAQLGVGPMALAKLLGALSTIDAPAAQQGLDALRAAGAEALAGARQRALAAAAPPDGDHQDDQEAMA